MSIGSPLVEDLGVELLGAVEQQEVNRFGKIEAKRLQSIPLPDLQKVDQAAFRQMIPGSRNRIAAASASMTTNIVRTW